MSPALPLSDDDLHAYADNQLPAERAREVTAALERDPALAVRVADLRRMNAQLRDATDPWLAEPLPRRLLTAATASRGRLHGGRSVLRHAWPALAAAASLVIGGVSGWMLRGEVLQEQGTPVTFSRQAALTHALYATDVNRPVEIWANEEERLVRWLSKRLSFQLHAPNLNSMGFALVGGRLVAGNEKPGALFMYENADKQRISLLVRKDAERSRETAFRYALEDGVGVFYWIDDKCGYALSGNLDRQQLLSIARVVYGQLAANDATPRTNP
jgi:anti-sigma factor RsiW